MAIYTKGEKNPTNSSQFVKITNLDVLLSSRASERTLTQVKAAIDELIKASGDNSAASLEVLQTISESIGDSGEADLKSKLLQVDEDSTPNVIYVGYANAGADKGLDEWSVKKVTCVGNNTEIEWADGNKDFDNIWDDRTSLTYS